LATRQNEKPLGADSITRFHGKYLWLSNFYPADVWLDGVKYRTVEHAYQAAKTTDESERKIIRKLDTPGQAKRLGRRVRMRPDWDRAKTDIMLDLLRQKFKDLTLSDNLLVTGSRELIEGNHWGDEFWGVDLRTGRGENTLGRLLMQVREEIRLGP
jgi:ribA/ribD-fused uncharacterized protein